MLTYVADVFGHALVVFFCLAIIKVQRGRFFLKPESFLNQSRRQYILENSVSV